VAERDKLPSYFSPLTTFSGALPQNTELVLMIHGKATEEEEEEEEE
jgi:hypothetical protein